MVDAAAAAQVGPGNLIWIGAASRGSGLLPAADVAGLPAGGFVIRAMSGRVVIGGADPLSVAEGVERLLGSQTPRPVASPASDATTATRAAAPFLSELYADDLPFFVQGFPACTGEFEPAAAERAVGGSTAIRDPGLLLAAVRRGERALPPGMVAAAAASAENCQQVRRLARNPFAGWAP
jgi:hypothetical protein